MGFKLFLNSRFFSQKQRLMDFTITKLAFSQWRHFSKTLGVDPSHIIPSPSPPFPSSLEVGPLNLARESGAGGCIFGPKGAIQIRYYFIIIIMK